METYRFAVFHSGAEFTFVEASKRLDGSLAVFTVLKSSLQNKDATCSPRVGLQSVACWCWKDSSAQPAGCREKAAEGIAGKRYHAVRLLQLLHVLESIILQVKCFHWWSNVHASNTKHSAVDNLNDNTNCWVSTLQPLEGVYPRAPFRSSGWKRKNMTSRDKLTAMSWRRKRRRTIPFLERWWILSAAQTWSWLSSFSSEETNTQILYKSPF